MSTLRDMLRPIPQDAEFHPEGDVWTHTRAVRRSLGQALELIRISPLAQHIGASLLALTPPERNLLRSAAWCHDVGKAHATILKNGRWASAGHERPPHLNPMLRRLNWPWRRMWVKGSVADRKALVYLITRHMSISDVRGLDERIIRALRSPDACRSRRALLLIVLMTMDRLGSGRPGRIEDARTVPESAARGLIEGGPNLASR